MGYRTIAISSSSAKKDFALKLGAHVFIDSSQQDPSQALQKLGGADVIVTTQSAGLDLAHLAAGLAWRGKLLILTVSVEQLQFNARKHALL